MTGADTRLGESLVSSADKEQTIFTGGIFAVEYCHGIAAFVAENQSFQQEVIGPASGMLAAVYQHLYLLESLRVNDRLMRSFYYHPVFRRLPQTLLGFVADLHHASLHHIADVGLVFQHFGNPLTAP